MPSPFGQGAPEIAGPNGPAGAYTYNLDGSGQPLTLDSGTTGILLLTGNAPSRRVVRFLSGAAGPVVLLGNRPLRRDQKSPTFAQVVLRGQLPRIQAGKTPRAGIVRLTGNVASLQVLVLRQITPANPAVLRITGVSPLRKSYVGARTGSIQILGYATRFLRILRGAGGGLRAIGQAPTVRTAYGPVKPTPGAITVAGHAPNMAFYVGVRAGHVVLFGGVPEVKLYDPVQEHGHVVGMMANTGTLLLRY